MKTILLTSLAVVAFGVCATPGHANHGRDLYRTLDEITMSALISARDLRWEIHDDFTASRNYRHLLRDANTLTQHLTDLQTLIHRGTSVRKLHHHVDTVIAFTAGMRSCLLESDYARGMGIPNAPFQNPGALFQGVPRHNPYRVHVDVALGYLAQVDANLQSMCALMSGRAIPPVIMPYQLNVPTSPGFAPSNGGVQFRQNVTPLPSVNPRGPALGPINGTTLKSHGHVHNVVDRNPRGTNAKGIDLPIHGKNGGIVLRIGN